jgi:tetratricopeptide (TPR) repeat protein
MSTRNLFLASSVAALLCVIVIGVIILPRRATAPASVSTATTTTSGATITVTSNKISTSTASLVQTFDPNYWLQLGLTRKEAGNYAGAAQAWQEVTKEEPQNYVAFYDLGDLYQNFEKNYPSAEKNYLTVVQLQPTYIDAYVSLYELYRNEYKVGTSAAADILAEGLKNNPNNAQLLSLQQQLSSGK